jgi:hypothetical protein
MPSLANRSRRVSAQFWFQKKTGERLRQDFGTNRARLFHTIDRRLDELSAFHVDRHWFRQLKRHPSLRSELDVLFSR